MDATPPGESPEEVAAVLAEVATTTVRRLLNRQDMSRQEIFGETAYGCISWDGR